MSSDLARRYIQSRRANPAWLLLASRRGPLVLSCLKPLFDEGAGEILWEDAAERLAAMLAEHANSEEYDVPEGEAGAAARRELRDWIKRRLIVEREGKILATDALEKAFSFIGSLDEEAMTSTASRLATVQREIENLAARLNPTREGRADYLRGKLTALQAELDRVEKGEFEVLSGAPAEEGIREVYQLAVSLRADFRRVEDSYREADRELRQEIVKADQDRGSVLDRMLDGNDSLLETTEGQVFDGFYEQLSRAVELDRMMERLRAILENEAASTLSRKQKDDLRFLVNNLVSESERVIQARARGERDVKGFLKTGLATEHHRVGALLNDILLAASDIDWSSQTVRRSPGSLPPVGIGLPALPLVQRLRFKEVGGEDSEDLDLRETAGRVEDLGGDFWDALDVLDREKLFNDTYIYLQNSPGPQPLSAIATALPPTHDLESLTYWLSMAREAGVPFTKEREPITLTPAGETATRFEVPLVKLGAEDVEPIKPEALG